MAGGPICPYCEKWWDKGPDVEEFANDTRVVYCPHCRKVVAVLPISVFAVPA